ncbi:MAG: HD-GYP domain-containing protein [Planctomycetota bacterium]
MGSDAIVAPEREIRLSKVLSALSYALDLTEGQAEGHAVRSALLGMRLAQELRLAVEERSALFYALLLKDLGCSSNAAKVCTLFAADDRSVKRGLKTVNWSNSRSESVLYVAKHAAHGSSPVKRAAQIAKLAMQGPSASKPLFEIRCERGAYIARLLGFSELTAQAIRGLDEHWDGRGYPDRLIGEEIPLLARILGIAQTVEVFFSAYGAAAAYEMAGERRGQWFDPTLVAALESIKHDSRFWERLGCADAAQELARYEPMESVLVADDVRLDRVAEGFAKVVDAKSPWTYRHSEGVAEIAVGVAEVLGFAPADLKMLKRAALLHDIGKLGVSNLILDKPGKLTPEERTEMQRHAEYSQRILERVACFSDFADLASAHHERLDGRGYHRGLSGASISLATRVLTVADIYEAMSAARPYRPKQPGERVIEIMSRDVGSAICPQCFEALRTFLDQQHWVPRAKVPVSTCELEQAGA